MRTPLAAFVRWRTPLMLSALMAAVLIAAASLFRPTVTGLIKSPGFRHDGGFAYVMSVPAPRTWLYRLKTDRAGKAHVSRLQVHEDGKALGPAHSSPAEVRQLGSGRYGHWGSQLWFSSSDGSDPRSNARTYEFRSKLSLKPLWSGIGIVSLVLVLALSLQALIETKRWDHAHRLLTLLTSWSSRAVALPMRTATAFAGVWRRYGLLLLRIPILVMRGVGYLLLAGSLVFWALSVFALISNWALPTAAPIRWLPWLYWSATYEPLFFLVLFSLAMAGAIASWFCLLFARTSAFRRDDILLGRFLQRWGFFLAASLFVFSVSAIWAGLVRRGDLNWASIAGLLPFSDAGNHFAAAHDQAKNGTWSVFALRRPIGAAFRSSMMFFSAYMHMAGVLLQAVLLACATYWASLAVGRWRGIYAGLAFFAFTYVTVRNYLPTFLSEPLGMFWALIAIPFLIAALCRHSLQNGLIGLAMVTVALFIRPGGMFVIGALGVWLIWRFGDGLKQKARTAAYVIVVVFSVVGASNLLNRAYGVGTELTGSNFSFTLCGLSIGTDYTGCINRYEEVRTLGSEKLLTDFMYQKALHNIAAQPEVITRRLLESAIAFTKELPAALWRGYSWWGNDYLNLRLLFFTLVGSGLLYIAIRRRERGEVIFWVLIWAGVIASSALVHFDDGRRVMSASYPLLWMFFAGGLLTSSVPTDGAVNAKRLARIGWIALLVTALLLFFIPWLAQRLSPLPNLQKSLNVTVTRPNEHVVLMDRRVSGMLVVPDGAELRSDFPAMSSSRFAEFIKASNVEIYQGILNPNDPKAPFGFIWAPRLENNATSDYNYIVPIDVIKQRDVTAWRFHIREWNRKEPYGPYWFYVDRAEPLK